MKVFALFFAAVALAHNANPVKPLDLSWEQWHMREEHQMEDYDAASFFALHDLKNQGYWTADDILYIYGLLRELVVGDGSGMGEHDHMEGIPRNLKLVVVAQVSKLLGADSEGKVSRDSWLSFLKSGGVLPDFGAGPGHHMDFEAEYENHHWNQYHRDQDPLVHIKHKEDIEHELLHHEHEIESSHYDKDARKALDDYQSLVKVQNVPKKYLA